jgi:hypothetical protein
MTSTEALSDQYVGLLSLMSVLDMYVVMWYAYLLPIYLSLCIKTTSHHTQGSFNLFSNISNWRMEG